MQKQCLECDNKIIGRIDKKFCCDGCRNAYNNRKNKDSSNLIRTTNNRLRKNYRILEKLNTQQKTKVSRTKLIDAGFDFNLFTGIYKTKAGATYFFVYDQGYISIEKELFLLIKKD